MCWRSALEEALHWQLARALKQHAPHLAAKEMAHEALKIAAEICVYTNYQYHR